MCVLGVYLPVPAFTAACPLAEIGPISIVCPPAFTWRRLSHAVSSLSQARAAPPTSALVQIRSPPTKFLETFSLFSLPPYSLRHDGELTVEGLEEFERRYFAGELRPHTKSETVSEEDEVGPVKRVKAASFERMVIENGELVRILRLTFANRECYSETQQDHGLLSYAHVVNFSIG